MTDTTHGTSRFDGGFLAAGDANPCLAALAVRVLNSLIEEVTLSRALDECDFSGEQQGRGRALKGKNAEEGVQRRERTSKGRPKPLKAARRHPAALGAGRRNAGPRAGSTGAPVAATKPQRNRGRSSM